MDQRRMQPGSSSERRRLLDLDDAPELDSSDETALDAIRRQLEEEFSAEAMPEASVPPEARRRPVDRPEPEERRSPRSSPVHAEPRSRPEREARARPGADTDERTRPVPSRDPRERPSSAWGRSERFRDERVGPQASRMVREPTDRLPAQRIPPQWREAEPPAPDEPRSRRGVFLTVGLAAGLTGGAAGALLTVLLLTGDRADFQRSWGRVVAAARDSGLADMATAVKDRALSADPSDRRDTAPSSVGSAQGTAGRPPAPTPRRGPVTTSEIAEAPQRGGGGQDAASLELRSLVAAGREAYVHRDYATAERLFAQAVDRSLADGLLRYHRAIALMGLGRFSEARIEFQNALRLGVDPVVADEARQALAQLSPGRRR